MDLEYLQRQLRELLAIPSPSGLTDEIVHHVGAELDRLGVRFELTRRGAIRADLPGEVSTPDRAVVAHLDTVGAMISGLRSSGRPSIAPVGRWPCRFAEGARVRIHSGRGPYTGTILPPRASGHIFGEDGVNSQPSTWADLEVRVDEVCDGLADLERLGIQVGDFVSIEPQAEFLPSGFITSRHLDDKAGVAVLLTVAREIASRGERLPMDCHVLFTISEEVGSGASAVLHQDVAEMVSIDNSTPGPGQCSMERGVTICMMDSTGPFDRHLTALLGDLCDQHGIPYRRDVFRDYRCDAASAVEAGNDLRTALICFGVDASHGYERTHMKSLEALAHLVGAYVRSGPCVKHDRFALGPLEGFPGGD